MADVRFKPQTTLLTSLPHITVPQLKMPFWSAKWILFLNEEVYKEQIFPIANYPDLLCTRTAKRDRFASSCPVLIFINSRELTHFSFKKLKEDTVFR